MILFIGQVARDVKEREAFQEVDYKRFFGDIAKWVVEIDDAARIPELVTRAFAVATSGRPGPVVISLPEDMLTERCGGAARLSPGRRSRPRPGEPRWSSWKTCSARQSVPSPSSAASRWSEAAVGLVPAARRRAGRCRSAVSFRRQMLFDHLHPSYAGDVGIGPNPELAAAIKDADLVLLVGGRFGEMPSSDYTLLKSPYPDQTLVHVHPDAGELGRVYRPTLAINASPDAFAEAFAKLAAGLAAGLGGRSRPAAQEPISPGRRRPKPDPARCRWGRS